MINSNLYLIKTCTHQLLSNKIAKTFFQNGAFDIIINQKLSYLKKSQHQCTCHCPAQYLHRIHNSRSKRSTKLVVFTNKNRWQFSEISSQQKIDYNSLSVIEQLQNLQSIHNRNKFTYSPSILTNLNETYITYFLEFKSQQQKIDMIYKSPEKDINKIVEQMRVMLQFSNKNINDQDLEGSRFEQILNKKPLEVIKKFSEKILNVSLVQTNNNLINVYFFFFYIESITKFQFQNIGSYQQNEKSIEIMANFFQAMNQGLNNIFNSVIQDIVVNYIEEPCYKKRDLFPFDIKLRGTCLLLFFKDKNLIKKYLQRLEDEALIPCMKQLQVVSIMYTILKFQLDLTDITILVYQIQSSRAYLQLFKFNYLYIKANFIQYVRKFMVCLHELHFQELFQASKFRKEDFNKISKLVRSFNVFKIETYDLHNEINKNFKSKNFNQLIAKICKASINMQNIQSFLLLFIQINTIEMTGEALYKKMINISKEYKSFFSNESNPNTMKTLYSIMRYVITSAKPVLIYSQKLQLKQYPNRQFTEQTVTLMQRLLNFLIDKYPHVLLLASQFLTGYVVSMDKIKLLVFYGNNQVPQANYQDYFGLSFSALKTYFSTIIQESRSLELYTTVNQQTPYTLTDFLQFLCRTEKKWFKLKSNLFLQQKKKFKLSFLYPIQSSLSFQQSIFKRSFQPLLQKFFLLVELNQTKQLTFRQFQELYRNLYLVLYCINLIGRSMLKIQKIQKYLQQIQKSVIKQIKFKLDKQQKKNTEEQTTQIKFFELAQPKGNIELLLCLNELIEITNKIQSINKKKKNFFGSIKKQLPSIYQFINEIAIQNLKATDQKDIFKILNLLKLIEEQKVSENNQNLLLKLNSQVYEYLYQSMSVFLLFQGETQQMYFRLLKQNVRDFQNVINQFIKNKTLFSQLKSKKRLIILQFIYIKLVKIRQNDIDKLNSQNSIISNRTLLDFLQIFQDPSKLTKEFIEVLQVAEFLPRELQHLGQFLIRFRDYNMSIEKYFLSGKVITKDLYSLSVDQLRQKLADCNSYQIYKKIFNDLTFKLPFELPQPKTENIKSRKLYILQKIFQKIFNANAININDDKANLNINEKQTKIKFKNQQISLFSENYEMKLKFSSVNLQQQKNYIKQYNLIEAAQLNSYRINQNSKLQLNFKKLYWKRVAPQIKHFKVESLQIQSRLYQQLQSSILLALFGNSLSFQLFEKKSRNKEIHLSIMESVRYKFNCQIEDFDPIYKLSKNNSFLYIFWTNNTNFKFFVICKYILEQSKKTVCIVNQDQDQTTFLSYLMKNYSHILIPETEK